MNSPQLLTLQYQFQNMNHINSSPGMIFPKKTKLYHIENSSQRKTSKMQEKFKSSKSLLEMVPMGNRQVKNRVG